MQLGMIGLGRMGANMTVRLIKAGHDCTVYDSHLSRFRHWLSRGQRVRPIYRRS